MARKTTPVLSKSRFVAGLQCPLRLWYQCYNRELAVADAGVPAIYEAGFVHDSVRIRVDFLERTQGGKWNLIEVKSSTSAKDVHLPDVAVQYRVLKTVSTTARLPASCWPSSRFAMAGRRTRATSWRSSRWSTPENTLISRELDRVTDRINTMTARRK